jgi:hypothetical protein
MFDTRRIAFAVLEHPAGKRFVQAPDSHDEMNLLHKAAREATWDFFCSTRLDGCGEKLMVVNGPQRRAT